MSVKNQEEFTWILTGDEPTIAAAWLKDGTHLTRVLKDQLSSPQWTITNTVKGGMGEKDPTKNQMPMLEPKTTATKIKSPC